MIKPVGGSLKDKALRSLRVTLASRGLRFTDSQWDALKALMEVLYAMASRPPVPVFYVSSLDPGLAKTTAVQEFLKALVSDPLYQQVGALVGFQTLDELEAFASGLSLPEGSLGVMTSSENHNSIASAPPASAQVLLTTHQMLRRRSQAQMSVDIPELRYNGRVRMVRVWDESFLPADPLVLSMNDIHAARRAIQFAAPKLIEDVDRLAGLVAKADLGSAITVPSFAYASTRLDDVLSDMVGDDKTRRTVEQLNLIAGRKAVVQDEGPQYGRCLVGYHQTFQEDIAPLLILDASARVRHTYTIWQRHRGGLERLSSARRSYTDLVIKRWDKGGGKVAWRNERQDGELMDVVAAAIWSKSAADWLVIHHLDTRFEQNLRKRLDGLEGTVNLLNWGRHQGINKFASISNVIVAGLLSYRRADYEAMWRAAGARGSGEHPEHEDIQKLKQGEYQNSLLQAVTRASIRRQTAGEGVQCTCYLIAPKKKLTDEALRRTFPGATITAWHPTASPPSKRARRVLAVIDEWLRAGADQDLLFTEVRRKANLGVSQALLEVRKQDAFQRALEERSVVEVGGAQRANAFRYAGRARAEAG